MADALSDLLYVLLGTYVSHGLHGHAEQLFDEVHRSNMSKLDQSGRPILREDGKILKPQAYVAQMKVERGFRTDDVIYECFLLGEELGELFKAVRKAEGSGRIADDSVAGNVGDELADCLIYLCSIANQMGVDLEASFRSKEEKNKSRVWRRPTDSP